MSPRLLLFMLLFVIGCASDYEAKEIDTKLEVKDTIDGSKVGLNDDDEVVIQTETDAADELRTQKWVNSKLEDELRHIYAELQQCREDLADPRLGGDGTLQEIPEIDTLKDVSDVKEEFGITEDGSLKIVKREYFTDHLKRERKYEKTLKSMTKVVNKHNESCQRRMGIARQRVGLPAERYKASGYFTNDGTWISSDKAENNLDDAFERAAKAKIKKE